MTLFQFPARRGEQVKTSNAVPLFDMQFDFDDIFTLGSDVQKIRSVGCFIVMLDTAGMLTFYDMNLVPVHKMSLSFVSDAGEDIEVGRALDFEFLDVGEMCDFSSDVKIMVKYKGKNGTEVSI